jgi:hypothetical protein
LVTGSAEEMSGYFRTNLNPEVSGLASGFFEIRKQLTEGNQRYNYSFCNAIGK